MQDRTSGGELRVTVIPEQIRAFHRRERGEHGGDEHTYENGAIDVPGYPEPNVTIHKSYEYYTYAEDTEERLDYVFNDEGTVASVTARATVVKIKHEYDIVVGNELFDPGVPEAGYRYEIKNIKDTELDRGTNSVVYTFIYR